MAGKSRLNLTPISEEHASVLRGALKVGIEKEALRVTPDASISQHPHPEALGQALTHKYITTDFAEAQLEFITPAESHMPTALETLLNLHVFTAKALPQNELLWNASMPPAINGEDEITIATYGNCNAARIKTLYRQGLAYRYGKTMQTISGIHYNFSLPNEFWELLRKQQHDKRAMQEFRSDGYLALIRNLQRHGWLLLYLFGASPVLDSSYVNQKVEGLEPLGDHSLAGEFATSLRMSDLGYSSVVQGKLDIHFNSMKDYLQGLRSALATSEKLYEDIGLLEGGSYKQINTHQLQLENELYGSARPKRVARNGERPIEALCHQGVEYIELRSLDINPFLRVGIDEEQINFLNTFLVLMSLLQSPAISGEEQRALQAQQLLVAREGRRPGLKMPAIENTPTLKNAGHDILAKAREVALLLDGGVAADHVQAVEDQLAKLEDVQKTPSAMVLERAKHYGSWQDFVQALSKAQTDNFRAMTLDIDEQRHQQAMVAQSRVAHAQMEAGAEQDFDQFLHNQYGIACPQQSN
nr:glutamate--cysteine ligase [Pseudovibrio stylochi]